MIDGAVAKGDTLVTIIVGSSENNKTYQLSKAKLVGISRYFKAALEGRWVEGDTQTVTLDEADHLSFDLLVQWIYYYAVVLPCSDTKSPAAADLTKYLNFLELATYLQIDGPCETCIELMEKLLNSDPKCLEPVHIQNAAKFLPRGNPVVQLFAHHCVEPYMRSKYSIAHPFRFENELRDLDGFAFALLSQLPMQRLLTEVVNHNRRGESLESFFKPKAGGK